MKTILKYSIKIFAMLGLMLSLSFAMTVPAQAQSNTDVTAVIFKNGSFKEAGNGRWDELDTAGNLRYSFREVRRDATSVYLREDALSVDLQIDIGRKMISAAWPGSPRQDLHKIDTYLLNPLTVTPPPVTPSPPPAVSPPLPPAPPTQGPNTDTNVNGLNVATIEYSGGSFRKSGTSRWQETSLTGANYLYDQLGNDVNSVYLYDSSRRLFLNVDLLDRSIEQSVGGVMSKMYKITALGSSRDLPPPNPEVTLRPGTMSPEKRVECAASGGTVERAGILGAERCTKRYNDGGMICTDTSQCQGKCLADTGDANKSNITGTCQKTDNPFGCYAEVNNGKSEFALCVD